MFNFSPFAGARAVSWLRRFVPAPVAIGWRERLRACCGAMLGVFVAGWLLHWGWPDGGPRHMALLIAPLGASAILLFALPASPLAQPWPLLGGNVVAALIGVACAHAFADPLVAATMALGCSIVAMFALRCVHPPAGAVALGAVLGGADVHAAGYGYALLPVGINSLLLLVAALLYHAATRHSYPHAAPKPARAEQSPSPRPGFAPEDLDAALKARDELLDIDRDDLAALLHDAEMHAYRRRFGATTCADIMSRDPVAVEFGSTLEEAWSLLRAHRIKALPVIDRSRRVIGIVTLADFMRHAQLDVHDGFAQKLRNFVARVTTDHADKPDAVGQIMATNVDTMSQHEPIVDLVPVFADAGHHHIPIVDDERRLVGIVTQSDLVVALYRQGLQPPRACAGAVR
jgi:CBS domain-containing membrane protein